MICRGRPPHGGLSHSQAGSSPRNRVTRLSSQSTHISGLCKPLRGAATEHIAQHTQKCSTWVARVWGVCPEVLFVRVLLRVHNSVCVCLSVSPFTSGKVRGSNCIRISVLCIIVAHLSVQNYVSGNFPGGPVAKTALSM